MEIEVPELRGAPAAGIGLDVMPKLDIMFWKLIISGGGLVIIVAELCLLVYELTTGIRVGFPIWARAAGLVAGLTAIVLAWAAPGEK